MEACARAAALWRDVRNTFNLLSSRKQREERHWSQPCNFCAVIIPVTTSDRGDINNQLPSSFCLSVALVFLQPQTPVDDAHVHAEHRTSTGNVLLDRRPESPKATCTWLGDAHFFSTEFLVSKLYGKWRGEAGTKKRGLVSIFTLISLPMGCARVWMPSALYVITPTNWSLLCSTDSLGRRRKLLGGRFILLDPLIRSRDRYTGHIIVPQSIPLCYSTNILPQSHTLLTLLWFGT